MQTVFILPTDYLSFYWKILKFETNISSIPNLTCLWSRLVQDNSNSMIQINLQDTFSSLQLLRSCTRRILIILSHHDSLGLHRKNNIEEEILPVHLE